MTKDGLATWFVGRGGGRWTHGGAGSYASH